jgi:hypothetical protein
MRQKRRGESFLEVIGGIAVLLAIAGGVYWYFNKDKGVRGVIDKVVPERPNPVVLVHRYDYRMFEDSNHLVTVKNVGGAGRVRVTSHVYRDQAATRLINTFSQVVYLVKGQQQEVTIRLYGVKEGASGVYVRASAQPE